MKWKWVNGCIRGFLKHKRFQLRQEIEPSPRVRHTGCLNSSLFSSDVERAATSSMRQNQEISVSPQSHFKDCRCVLTCEDTSIKIQRKKETTACTQLVRFLIYLKSLNRWRWSVVATSKWEVSKWSSAVISTNSSSAATPQGERHPDWVAESSRL